MKSPQKQINLALQGGGAHGAFTWGVLDKLLDEDRLDIEGITGSSAGAINGALMISGYANGGVQGAKTALRKFWTEIAQDGAYSPIQRNFWDKFTGQWSLDANPGFMFLDILSHMVSPYDLNPLNLNPFNDLLEEIIDFEAIRKCKEFKIFVAATNVLTGKIRIFEQHEITAKVLLASACLPQIYQAVEIDGIPYWDGGYMGNPALYPLFYKAACADILLVSINPIERNETPKTAREIQNRLNEITFNATLLRELRAIDFVSKLVDEGKISKDKYKSIKLHQIEADDEIRPLSASSKMNVEMDFLEHLFKLGNQKANSWLEKNYNDIGKKSTVDLKKLYE